MPRFWRNKAKQREWLATYCKGKGADLGCGHKKIVESAIGVDSARDDPECVADVFADVSKLAFGDGELDYVVACHVLEHLPNTKAVLREWRRVLKSDGVLAIAVPDAGRQPRTLKDENHLVAFTEATLAAFLQYSGFSDLCWKLIEEGGWPCIVVAAKKRHAAKIPESG